MNTDRISKDEHLDDSRDDLTFRHFNNFLKMYDDMIEESKNMNGGLLSNDYIYLKPVFQQIFDLIISSVETNQGDLINNDTDEDYLSE